MSQPLSRVFLRFHVDATSFGVPESIATASIEFMSVLDAPVGECVGVDVRFDDHVALAKETLASLFSKILPLQECAGQDVAVDEHGFQTVVVRFVIPNHGDNLNLCG